MSGRKESEAKKTEFIKACDDLDSLKVLPEKILQAQMLKNALEMEEIDVTMLYKSGCPCDWIPNATIECNARTRKPKYSNKCTECWFQNLTDEVDDEKTEMSLEEILERYKEFQKLQLEPSQIEEILVYLGWNEIYDYGLFIDTIKDMRRVYDESK